MISPKETTTHLDDLAEGILIAMLRHGQVDASLIAEPKTLALLTYNLAAAMLIEGHGRRDDLVEVKPGPDDLVDVRPGPREIARLGGIIHDLEVDRDSVKQQRDDAATGRNYWKAQAEKAREETAGMRERAREPLKEPTQEDGPQ